MFTLSIITAPFIGFIIPYPFRPHNKSLVYLSQPEVEPLLVRSQKVTQNKKALARLCILSEEKHEH
ncbi:MAG: hypothetical protein IKL84_04830, partial [Clostridia bacterium]|nr:hypothetical protein [Clostridia bacterium]